MDLNQIAETLRVCNETLAKLLQETERLSVVVAEVQTSRDTCATALVDMTKQSGNMDKITAVRNTLSMFPDNPEVFSTMTKLLSDLETPIATKKAEIAALDVRLASVERELQIAKEEYSSEVVCFKELFESRPFVEIIAHVRREHDMVAEEESNRMRSGAGAADDPAMFSAELEVEDETMFTVARAAQFCATGAEDVVDAFMKPWARVVCRRARPYKWTTFKVVTEGISQCVANDTFSGNSIHFLNHVMEFCARNIPDGYFEEDVLPVFNCVLKCFECVKHNKSWLQQLADVFWRNGGGTHVIAFQNVGTTCGSGTVSDMLRCAALNTTMKITDAQRDALEALKIPVTKP